MNIKILTVLFLSPLLSFAIYLIIKENKDPLADFHDHFSKKANSSRSDGVSSVFINAIKKKSLLVISSFFFVALLVISGADTQLLLIALACFGSYLYSLIRAQEKDRKVRLELAEHELPAIVEMFSILVSGGESPASALIKIAESSEGELSTQLKELIIYLKNGGNLKSALEILERRVRSIPVRRFCDSVIISIDRGSSLSDVLVRQVEELRNHQRANLIKKAGKIEILLMVPIVFLILPISILFALWPSYVALGTSIG